MAQRRRRHLSCFCRQNIRSMHLALNLSRDGSIIIIIINVNPRDREWAFNGSDLVAANVHPATLPVPSFQFVAPSSVILVSDSYNHKVVKLAAREDKHERQDLRPGHPLRLLGLFKSNISLLCPTLCSSSDQSNISLRSNNQPSC